MIVSAMSTIHILLLLAANDLPSGTELQPPASPGFCLPKAKPGLAGGGVAGMVSMLLLAKE